MGEDGVVHLIHVGTNDRVADIMKKPLLAEPFERHVCSGSLLKTS